MEKRRIFKRKKTPEVEKTVSGNKKTEDKKSAAKKLLAVVKRPKPEPTVKQKVTSDVASDAAAIVAAVEKAEAAEAAQASKAPKPEITSDNIAETPSNDVVVIEETTTTVTTDFANESHATNKRSLGFIFVLLAIFAIFLAGGLAFAFLFQQPPKPEHVYTAPTDIPSPTIAQAPEPALWKIEVLNGSGISGAAAKFAQKLEKLGYTVTKVGNADESQIKTTFYLSKDFLPYADTFKENLAKEEITASNGGELQNSTYSAQIILGSE